MSPKLGSWSFPGKHFNINESISLPHVRPRHNQTSNQTSAESLVYPCIPAAFVGFPFSFPFGGGKGSWVIIRAGGRSAVCELLPPESTAAESSSRVYTCFQNCDLGMFPG